MPTCKNCADLLKTISSTPVISGAGSNPSILELAYMANLEYYFEMKYSCVHEIPEPKSAKFKIKDMVDFLESRKWKIGTRTQYKGFSCSTFLNRPAKQVVIIHRGTENLTQVATDVALLFDLVSLDDIAKADWHTYQSLMNNALKEQNNRFVRNDYSVTISGHSLGGWLAQLCTLLCRYPKYHPVGPRGNIEFPNGKSIDLNQPFDLHCVAFDSPGARNILERLNKVSKKSFSHDLDDALETLDITIYLSNKNRINSCGQHVGTVHRMDVMSEESWLQKMNPIASHSMERILAFLVKNPNYSNPIDPNSWCVLS